MVPGRARSTGLGPLLARAERPGRTSMGFQHRRSAWRGSSAEDRSLTGGATHGLRRHVRRPSCSRWSVRAHPRITFGVGRVDAPRTGKGHGMEARRRSTHHQLVFALQMCTVRYIERFLPDDPLDPLDAPWPVVEPLSIKGASRVKRYTERPKTAQDRVLCGVSAETFAVAQCGCRPEKGQIAGGTAFVAVVESAIAGQPRHGPLDGQGASASAAPAPTLRRPPAEAPELCGVTCGARGRSGCDQAGGLGVQVGVVLLDVTGLELRLRVGPMLAATTTAAAPRDLGRPGVSQPKAEGRPAPE